jgi:RNA polymerase sigma-70 factor, ECF subfamily
VARLPEAQRAVMLLVAVEGLSYREAADILSIPVGTVMSRLARARLTIGEAFGASPPRSSF